MSENLALALSDVTDAVETGCNTPYTAANLSQAPKWESWQDLTANWHERARRSTLGLLLACSVANGATVTAALPNQVQHV